jgi:hypothetical protein
MEQPENLIPKEKMVEILRDLAVLNAAKTTNVGILQKNKVEPMPYLYAKYGIDSTQFSDSDRYYASLPEEYADIYEKVETRLEVEKEEIEERKRVKDSLEVKEREFKREATGTTDSLP